MRKNKYLNRCIFIVILCMIIALMLGNLAAAYSFQKMSEEYYTVLASLLGSVKEKYPDIAEEEWVKLLNDNSQYVNEQYASEQYASEQHTNGQYASEQHTNGQYASEQYTNGQYAGEQYANSQYDRGRRLLEQYGIFEDYAVMARQQKLQGQLALWNNLIFAFMGVCIIGILLFYHRRRVKNVDSMTAYIRRVEQGEYLIPMLENKEDELSSLKNELYKVTVMLKESALLSQNQKKALSDSVSDISHQIKTPLTSAMILLDNLSESEQMEEATRKRFLAEITRQVSHINWLAATMLKLSRLDAGVVEFTAQPFRLDALLEEVLEELEMLAEWKQISMVREGDTDVHLAGDFQWIKEAVTNVVKNAIEHSPEGGRICLRTQDNTVYTAVSIKDFGEGMDEEEQKHVFERFFRSRDSAKDSVGIGLSLAKEIIEHQNGYLTVESQKGEGTEFVIKFLKT